MKPLTRSSYEFEVRAASDDNGTHITGRPIVYNSRTNLGCFDEIIEKGALDKANLKDVRFLVNHDTSKIPLARSRNNNKNSNKNKTTQPKKMTKKQAKIERKKKKIKKILKLIILIALIAGGTCFALISPIFNIEKISYFSIFVAYKKLTFCEF